MADVKILIRDIWVKLHQICGCLQDESGLRGRIIGRTLGAQYPNNLPAIITDRHGRHGKCVIFSHFCESALDEEIRFRLSGESHGISSVLRPLKTLSNPPGAGMILPLLMTP